MKFTDARHLFPKPISRTQERLFKRKFAILARSDFRCHYCRKPLTPDTMTKDHVIPRSRGGLNLKRNTVAACFSCNHSKANRTPQEWEHHRDEKARSSK